MTKATKQRRVLATVPRDLEEGPLSCGHVSVEGSQGGVDAHLIDEYQHHPGSRRPTSMRYTTLKNTSRSAAPLDLFFGSCKGVLSLDKASLRSPSTPETAYRNWALWEWVAHRRSWRSSKRSLVAFSSNFGARCLDPSSVRAFRARRVACRSCAGSA